MKKVLLAVAALVLVAAGMAAAEEGGVEIGLDYRFRVDSLKGTVHEYIDSGMRPGAVGGPHPGYDVENNTIFMNRFGMHLKANPLEDVTMKAKFDMYKVSGHQTSDPAFGGFFADRFGAANDGTKGHVPEDSVMRVDYAYATVSNIFGQPIWYSVGRRPSTGGIPSNIRQNAEKQGTAGIPSLMVNYAFDGMTLGYAPDIAALPGFYAKICYGRGYDSGFQATDPKIGGYNNTKDTDFYGLNAALMDTEKLHIEVQYQTGRNIFDRPSDAGVAANLGNLNWLGAVVMGKASNVNWFVTAAGSKSDPNGQAAGGGPLTPFSGSLLNNGTNSESHSGNAIYLGGRYDIASTGTKIGAEWNHGSRYWISMVPAEDDLWTGKLGTRGNVYEVYIIQSLNRKPIAKKGEAFVRLGYQLYKFNYTNSNNWVGGSTKISDLNQTNPANAQYFVPIEKAQDIYLTFDVRF